MGFFGTSMVVKAEVELSGLEVIRAAGGEPDAESTGSDGWRFLRVFQGDMLQEDDIRAVADQVDGPFFVAYIVDSDFAVVFCAAPGLPVQRFVLHEDMAVDYDCPVDAREQQDAVPYLMRWAGGGADEKLVREALQGSLTFAEDSVLRLAAAVGAIPAGSLEDQLFGDLEES